MLNTVVNPMLNSLGGGGKKGNQLIQLGGSFNSLAGTAVIIMTGILIPSIAKAQISDVFPLMYAALGIFAFAFAVILLSNIPQPAANTTEPAAEKSKIGPMSFSHFVLGAIGIFVYVGVEVGIPNVLQKWLQNDTLNVLKVTEGAEAIAASVAATYWFLMLIGRLVGAAIGAKVSAKAMLTTVSLTGIVLVLGAIFASTDTFVSMPVFKNSAEGLFGLVNVPINAMFLVLVGLCTSVMWGGIFNLAVEGLGKYTERASGIFMALVCGGGVLPLIQNAIVDLQGGTGYQASYWLVVAGLAYLLFYALIGSKVKNKAE
jgi:FHS family L-fucose permease-like MFS transporter